MEQYYRITMVNPFNNLIDLSDVLTVLGTSGMIRDWSLGIIDIDNDIIPHYVKNYIPVEIMEIKTDIIEGNISEVKKNEDFEKVIELTDGTKVKIVFSFLIYDEVHYVYNEENYTAVRIKNIKNLAIKSANGMEPLDKQDRYNFVVFKNHNKRKLIKRGVFYIHNHLIGNDIICDSFGLFLQGLTP